MKEEIRRKIISFSFLGLAIICFIGTIIFLINNEPNFRDDLPCYDKNNNKIKGQVCEGYEQDDNIILIFPSAIVIAILLSLSHIKHPERDYAF